MKKIKILAFLIVTIPFANAVTGEKIYNTIVPEVSEGNECLIIGKNGTAPSPSRYNWGHGSENCGFPDLNSNGNNLDDLLANKQAVFKINNIQDNKFIIETEVSGGNECLIISKNGTASSPSRYNWGHGSKNCGFPDLNNNGNNLDDLLANKQAIFKITNIQDNKYIIETEVSGSSECLIIGKNGTASSPSRYNWGHGSENCGFPDLNSNGNNLDDLLANKQAIYTFNNLSAPQCSPWTGQVPEVGSYLRFKNVVAQDIYIGPSIYRTELANKYLVNTFDQQYGPVPKFVGTDAMSELALYKVTASRFHSDGPEIQLQSPSQGVGANSSLGFTNRDYYFGASFITGQSSLPLHTRWMRLAHRYRADIDSSNTVTFLDNKVPPVAILQRFLRNDHSPASCSQTYFGRYRIVDCRRRPIEVRGHPGESNRHLAANAYDVVIETCTPYITE